MAKETILVVGGCGFVGYHIVKQLRQEHRGSEVHVMSRNPIVNLVQDVQYHSASITSYPEIRSILLLVSPTVIIHSASPAAVGAKADEKGCFRINVEGTRCLLDCAASLQTVKAFIFTSSVTAMEGSSHYWIREDAPLKTRSNKGDEYSKSKAAADRLVLVANTSPALQPSGACWSLLEPAGA